MSGTINQNYICEHIVVLHDKFRLFRFFPIVKKGLSQTNDNSVI